MERQAVNRSSLGRADVPVDRTGQAVRGIIVDEDFDLRVAPIESRAQKSVGEVRLLGQGPCHGGPGSRIGGFVLDRDRPDGDAQGLHLVHVPGKVARIDPLKRILQWVIPIACPLIEPEVTTLAEMPRVLHPGRGAPGGGDDSHGRIDGEDFPDDRDDVLEVLGGIGRARLPLTQGEVFQVLVMVPVGNVVIGVIRLGGRFAGPQGNADAGEPGLVGIEHVVQHGMALFLGLASPDQRGCGIGDGGSGTQPGLMLLTRVDDYRRGTIWGIGELRRIQGAPPVRQVSRCHGPILVAEHVRHCIPLNVDLEREESGQ